MRRLHLLRHAKSSRDDPLLADHERPLAPRGRRAGADMRRWLERAGVRPGLVLCSDAARTRQTLELVRPALGSPEIQSDERLYLATGEDLLQCVRALPDTVAEAMLVGHNPGLHDLALLLADERGRAELSEHLPTGALVTLDLPAPSWTEVAEAEATLVSFVKPRDL